MCDYSLCGIPNRLALERETLIVYRFPTGSMGLASPADMKLPVQASGQSIWGHLRRVFFDEPQRNVVLAVCIPPGAHLVLRDIPEDLRRQWRVEDSEGVVFVQTSANVNSHRDAMQFHDGRLIRLQDLREGMLVEVLSLAGAFVRAEEDVLALL